MAKKLPSPWKHQASGYWCIQLNGTRHYLHRDFAIAKRKLRALLAEEQRRQAGCNEWFDAPFADLASEFLDDIKARRAAGTYGQCRYGILRALKILGASLRVGEVRRFHLAKIEQSMTGDYSPSTIRDTIAKVQQVFSWSVEHELLDHNPLAGYRKPAGRARTRIITPAEFQALLRACGQNPAFRRVLLALRLVGCRPGELRTLRWNMVDLENGMWVLPDHKTITTQRAPRPRIIPLPDSIARMSRWLSRRDRVSDGFVFLNMWGKPYTKDRLVECMDRARSRAGIETAAGERIVLYSNRHTFGTEAAGKITDIELAELMGHTTTHTTKRYVHLNVARLQDIQRRAQGR